ncbi:MAG: hypothetical protein WCP72_11615 [Desulfomonile sp.]
MEQSSVRMDFARFTFAQAYSGEEFITDVPHDDAGGWAVGSSPLTAIVAGVKRVQGHRG